MKLSTILKVLDKLNVHRGSYLYGTFMDICGFPRERSLYDRRTGLITPANGSTNLNEAMIFIVKKTRLKSRMFHMGRKPTDLKIWIEPIEVDLTLEEINSKKYLQDGK